MTANPFALRKAVATSIFATQNRARETLVPRAMPRSLQFTMVGLGLELCAGCYGGIGPSVGLMLPTAEPTIGWEASAATVTVGKSYAIYGRARDWEAFRYPDYHWRQRTYLLWEPRRGRVIGDSDRDFGMIGGGASIGMRWDLPDQPGVKPRFGALGGVWGGGGYVFSGGQNTSCSDDTRAYLSLALGVRGNEIYLTPKVGFLTIPGFCINLGSHL